MIQMIFALSGSCRYRCFEIAMMFLTDKSILFIFFALFEQLTLKERHFDY